MRYEDNELVDATLDLPVESYRAWLERQGPTAIVGYELSRYDTPIGRYLMQTIGACNQLHSDGKRAWFLLRLTRGNMSESDCHLRMILPDWTAPLVAYYSAFPVGRVSSQPQEKGVSRVQAQADLRRLVEEARHRKQRKVNPS